MGGGGRGCLLGEGGLCAAFLLLVAKEHVVIVPVPLALVLEVLEFLFQVELGLLLEFIGEEESFPGGALMGGEILDEIFDFFMGGDEEAGFIELEGLFLHENNCEIGVLTTIRQSRQYFVSVLYFHQYAIVNITTKGRFPALCDQKEKLIKILTDSFLLEYTLLK